MTVPMTPGAPVPPPAPAPEAVTFPLSWMLENAISPLQYRASTDIARLGSLPSSFSLLCYCYPPALTLALRQNLDGVWGGSMLSIPSARGGGSAEHFDGVGTVSAVRRLLEYGWDRESPPLVRARRILFRLLAEDDDPPFVFEMAGKGAADAATIHHARGILREAAAAALAQAGS